MKPAAGSPCVTSRHRSLVIRFCEWPAALEEVASLFSCESIGV